ncbi:MAG: type II toxin-antitoxin system RelE/ParE family toxin [Alphaproteobacteria bacterium]
MRVFKTKPFARFANAERIADAALLDAVRRAEAGLIDADLGGGVIKQRIARSGQGKSGGYRSIVLFRRGDLAYFVYGFPKNSRDNLRRDELKGFRRLADRMLGFDDRAIAVALRDKDMKEVDYDD